MFGIVFVLGHPGFEGRDWLRPHLAIVRKVRIVLDLSLEIAREVGIGSSKYGKQNDKLLARLLPFSGIGLEAEGSPQLLGAFEAEIDATGFTIFKQVGSALPLRFIQHLVVIEVGLAAAKDMDAQRIVGGVFAFGKESDRGKRQAKENRSQKTHEDNPSNVYGANRIGEKLRPQ